MMVFKGACSSSISLNKKLNYMCEVDQQDHQRTDQVVFLRSGPMTDLSQINLSVMVPNLQDTQAFEGK